MVPKTTEINHPLVETLLSKSDQELLALFQAHPNLGKYLLAIFCRYAQIIYTLTRDSGKSAKQSDFLFAKTWERIEHELRLIEISTIRSLQNLLIDITGVVLNSLVAPENCKYDLSLTPPIFFCYLNQALAKLAPDLRLVLILSDTFNWSSARIAAYLQSEDDLLRAAFGRHKVKNIEQLISKANSTLIQLLPIDIQEIYL